MRPHIVWFGEAVPLLDKAVDLTAQADLIIVVGTSMQVYPAAGLVSVAPKTTPVYYIDPNPKPNHELALRKNVTIIPQPATVGLVDLVNKLLNQ